MIDRLIYKSGYAKNAEESEYPELYPSIAFNFGIRLPDPAVSGGAISTNITSLCGNFEIDDTTVAATSIYKPGVVNFSIDSGTVTGTTPVLTDTNNYTALYAHWSTATWHSNQTLFRYNGNRDHAYFYTGSAAKYEYWQQDNGGSWRHISIGPASVVPNSHHVMIGRNAYARDSALYFDVNQGGSIFSGSLTGLTTGFDSWSLTDMDFNSNNNLSRGNTHYYEWDRVLSDSAVRFLLQDPDAPFRKRRRIFPVSSAAAPAGFDVRKQVMAIV